MELQVFTPTFEVHDFRFGRTTCGVCLDPHVKLDSRVRVGKRIGFRVELQEPIMDNEIDVVVVPAGTHVFCEDCFENCISHYKCRVLKPIHDGVWKNDHRYLSGKGF